MKNLFEKILNQKTATYKEVMSIKKMVQELNAKIEVNDYTLEEMNKWKTKFNNEHQKYCEYEIKTAKRLLELEKELKSIKRQNKKLEKESKDVQM